MGTVRPRKQVQRRPVLGRSKGPTAPRGSVGAKSLAITRRLRIHAIPLADDDGGRSFDFTPQDLAASVEAANVCLDSAGVELVFDPAHDWQPRHDTELNNLHNDPDTAAWWKAGNAVAERIPGKIVIFFRHGPKSKPTGNGHGYPPATGHPVPKSAKLPTSNVRYVAMPNRLARVNQNPSFFAHEIGHYLGLFHTFPGWGAGHVYGEDPKPKTLSIAQASAKLASYIFNNGGSEAAMDGDLLADTAPDPGSTIYRAAEVSEAADGPATIDVKGVLLGKQYDFEFTPPRNNAMSYFRWGEPQSFTPQQRQRVHETLQHPHRRDLIQAPCTSDFHDLVSSDFQKCFDYWVHRGMWPQTLSASFTRGSLRMAGSFQPGSSRPVRSMQTSTGYQKAFEKFRDDGFRPRRVVAVNTPKGTRFTAIWTPIDGKFEAAHALTFAQYEDMWHDMRAKGWLIVDLNVYSHGNGHRVAAVWVDTAWDAYETRTGMTADEYQQKFDDLRKVGLHPTTFCAYQVGKARRYAATWERVPGQWAHWFGMTGAQYQDKYDAMVKGGFRLHQVQAYGARFSAIWRM